MFNLYRKGQFACKLTGTIHCGIKPDNVFEYEVKITVTDEGLDEHGFVLDNAELKKYFDGIKETPLSCELLCCKAARHFAKRVLENHPDCCISSAVRIYGLPNEAYASYVWRAGESLEPLHPLLVEKTKRPKRK